MTLDQWIAQKAGDVPVYQAEQLQKTVDHCRTHSPFYRGKLDGLHFHQMPTTSAGDIARDPFSFLCIPQSKVVRIVTMQTSGTSGQRKRIFFSENDLARTVEFFHHGMGVMTQPGDRVMVLFPSAAYGSVGDLLIKGLARLGAEALGYGVPVCDREAAAFAGAHAVDVLAGLPMDVLRLSEQMRRQGLRARSVLLSADVVTDALRARIKENLHCDVFEHYGMTEMCFGGGVNEEEGGAYRLRDADLYFEIIDPATRQPVPDGQYGEVVFTTLGREAMPLLRYRTGDISRIDCDPRTKIRRLRRISHRRTDEMTFGDWQITLPELADAAISAGALDFYIRKGKKVIELQVYADREAVERALQVRGIWHMAKRQGVAILVREMDVLRRDPRAMTKKRVETI